ncbi:MAG TPA: transposase [Bryobacteraceae bacterium]|nr:transposase [Bryobacteraceae bacterium]
MPRRTRLILPGFPHHVTQRGNHSQQIFFSDADRRLYLDLIVDSAEQAQVRLWGWCLMNNHVHWIVEPQTELGLARLFRRAHGEYARHRHRLLRMTGHFWEARYFSCPLDRIHRWQALAYVERNPVRAGVVRSAQEYVWSSARIHTGIQIAGPDIEMQQWRANYTSSDWCEVLDTSLGEAALARRLREATRVGFPCGTPEFIQELEQAHGPQFRPRPRGRPALTPAVLEHQRPGGLGCQAAQ